MDKKEKYINYIVDDLMKNTFQMARDMIQTPVHYEDDGDPYYFHKDTDDSFVEDIRYLFNEDLDFNEELKTLLHAKFGANESEYENVMNKYKELLLTKYSYNV